MTTKVTIAALVLAALPAMSFASCNWGEHKMDTAMSCAEGTTYDQEKGACVPISTS